MLDALEFGLEKGDLVLLDSAPLVYLIEGRGEARQVVVEAFFAAARASSIRLAASTLVWAELLRGPLARADEELSLSYRRLLSDSSLICLEPVDAAIAETAAGLVAAEAGRLSGKKATGPGLELPDAIHLATAIVLGAAAVLTNDEAWKAFAEARDFKPKLPPILLVDELAFLA